MACSPEQLAANRRNALKSTGPTSPEGRAKVARNALKHGLTGEGIVVPDEDVALIQERFDDFDRDLNPFGVVAEFLIRRLALLSVRLDRCARYEAANQAKRMLLAEQSESDAHRDDLQRRVDKMNDEPEIAIRELQRSPRGLAWMIDAWEDLKTSLLNPSPYAWHSAQIERAENLMGSRYASPHPTRIGMLSSAYHGHFDKLRPDDWPDLPEADRKIAARDEIARIMDAEIARLKDVLGKIDRAKLAEIDSGAMARALFDASKESVLFRKYEGATERAFFKTLKTIQELNAAAMADQAPEPDDTTRYDETDSGDLALNGSEPVTAEEKRLRRPPAPADRRKSKGRRADRTWKGGPNRPGA